MRVLARYLGPRWPLLVAVIAFQTSQALASLVLPSINATLVDDGIAHGDIAIISRMGTIMLAVTFVQIACSIAAVYFAARAAMGLGRDLRGAVFDRVLSFSQREVTEFGAPTLITRTTNDVQQVQMVVLMMCTVFVSAPILAVGGVVMALQQDVGLSWLMAVCVPVLVVAISIVVGKMVPLFRLMQQRVDSVNRVMREQLAGIRVVRAFVRERTETERFGRANLELTEVALSVGRLAAILFPFVMLVMNASSVAVIWFGALRVDDGEIQVGTVMAFLQYLLQILLGVLGATLIAVMIPRAAVSAGRIGEVLATQSSVTLPATGASAMTAPGALELCGVSFAYPGAERKVIDDVTFSVPAGKVTAIIGLTGSGKTTLVNLLTRLVDVTEGAVLVGGVDVRKVDPSALWSSIALVPQRPYLFSGTVASNLRYGRPDAVEDEMWEALRIAQAVDFVRGMDGGLDARIAQGGMNVSGGQRQRLSIARALMARAAIEIYDDSFSALDTATETRLRRALRTRESRATQVIVAQRVSTIVDADDIIVLEEGRVVGRGRHEHLLQTSLIYQEIVESQRSAEAAP
jgi:ATP-binding cassette subfamily B multidrug efflux pump